MYEEDTWKCLKLVLRPRHTRCIKTPKQPCSMPYKLKLPPIVSKFSNSCKSLSSIHKKPLSIKPLKVNDAAYKYILREKNHNLPHIPKRSHSCSSIKPMWEDEKFVNKSLVQEFFAFRALEYLKNNYDFTGNKTIVN